MSLYIKMHYSYCKEIADNIASDDNDLRSKVSGNGLGGLMGIFDTLPLPLKY